jgi:hypothetical protein
MPEKPTPDQERIGNMADLQARPGIDDDTINFLNSKTGIMVAIPNLGGKINTPLAMWLLGLSYRTIDPESRYFFKIHMPFGLSPVEYARNECVREFLSDPYYKKLWFIDADMIPPPNAFDILGFDDDIVAGMTYVWKGGVVDNKGVYQPPKMQINAYDFRPQHEDFISRMPHNDNRSFYCDAVGAACMTISRKLLEVMPEPWFRTLRDPYGAGIRGEDLDFCKRAQDLQGTKVLYVPKVQFGHVKELDLNEVTKYGLVSMRNIIEQVKKFDPDSVAAKGLPNIRFQGENVEQSLEGAPTVLKVISGGAA